MDPYSAQLMILSRLGQWSGGLIDGVRSALVAVAIFIAGLMVSEILRFLGTAGLRLIRWDALSQRLGLTRRLHRWRADLTPSVFTGQVIFWFSIISFTLKAVEKLNLPWVSGLGALYFDFLPAGLQGLGLLAVTWIAARGCARLLLIADEGPGALLGARLGQAVVAAVGIFASLQVVGVDRALGLPVVLILFGGAVFGLCWAWGNGRGDLLRPVVRIEGGEESN